jgi:hypothetical protein
MDNSTENTIKIILLSILGLALTMYCYKEAVKITRSSGIIRGGKAGSTFRGTVKSMARMVGIPIKSN